MNRNRILRLSSLALGLLSLALALGGGIHLQHLIDDGGSRHLGETLVFIILALGLFAGSVWTCHRERKAE
jgi:high-affinity Fe2+/Pb2+ permease